MVRTNTLKLGLNSDFKVLICMFLMVGDVHFDWHGYLHKKMQKCFMDL